jgi:phosphatidylserine/phosphatidylglycerophosphate/cardiolipin synthase-like enzyme
VLFQELWSAGRRIITVLGFVVVASMPAAASDRIYFPATDDAIVPIVNRIYAETVRIDISAWYLTEHMISIAIADRFAAGVPVRIIGDRASIFEIDPNTRREFYWLASQGVPIRLRCNPDYFPEIAHWKAGLFVGQGVAEFGSANWTTFELAPDAGNPAGNFHDETVLFTDDPILFGAMETRFDQMWADTANEPQSIYGPAPYLRNWNDACALEPVCSDYATIHPNPAPMVIDQTSKVVTPTPPPPDLIFGQGPEFNNRMVTEIGNERSGIDLVIYRLTVDSITTALINAFASGVPVRVIIEPNQYTEARWTEYWQTHANIDRLWAAGIPIVQRTHQGLTHMKMLVTSNFATNASSNYAANWQRDHDYFVPAAAKPDIYRAMANRFQIMWSDTTNFAPFAPGPPAAPWLADPAPDSTGVPVTPTLTWNAAPFATSYDVYLAAAGQPLTRVAGVPAQVSNDPPSTYSFTPTTPLNPGTTYSWQIVSRTFATDNNPGLVAASDIWTFTTMTSDPPPPAGGAAVIP